MKKELIIENFKNKVKKHYKSGEISYVHIFDIIGAPPSLDDLVMLLGDAIDDAENNKTTEESPGIIEPKLNMKEFYR